MKYLLMPTAGSMLGISCSGGEGEKINRTGLPRCGLPFTSMPKLLLTLLSEH